MKPPPDQSTSEEQGRTQQGCSEQEMGNPLQSPSRTGFSVQLVLFPLIIVILFVGIRLMVSQSDHSDDDLRALVRDLRDVNEDRWQKAYALSQRLRSDDHAELKRDEVICRELASILLEQIRTGGDSEAAVQFQVFLCRALGEFHVDDGLSALLDAAERDGGESTHLVRRAAVEAIAVLAGNIGLETMRANPHTVQILVSVSRAGNATRASELRSTSAFALGVIGGADALDRLAAMLDDPHCDTRFNAATGLARHGDARAVPTLLAMLDPQNHDAAAGEKSPEIRARKEALVLTNAIRATVRLLEANRSLERAPLLARVQQLTESKEVSARIRMDAQTAILNLRD